MKTLLVLATALLAGSTFAAAPKGASRPMPGPRSGMMQAPNDPIVRLIQNPSVAKEIGLTDEQKKKIAEINKSSRAPELQKDLREANRRQAELMKAEKVDEAAVMAEIDKVYDIRKEMAKRQTKRVIAIKSILTPEQVSKALELLKNRAAARRAKPGPAGEPKEKGPEGVPPPKPAADAAAPAKE